MPSDRPVSPQPRPMRDPRIAAAQIALGHGQVDIGPFQLDDRVGVLLAPRKNGPIPLGEPGALQDVAYEPTADDVVIWLDGPDAGDVLIAQIEAVSAAARGA